MDPTSTILVLTASDDFTADYIVAELNERGVPVFRCNPSQFPLELQMVARLGVQWDGLLVLQDREVRLSEIRCCYYRRPTAFTFSPELSEPERRWARLEARAGFGGVLTAQQRWLNHPARIAEAEYKPLQLQVAQSVGLSVPDTLISNSPLAAREFCRHHDAVIYKPLAGGGIAEDGEYRLIYCNGVGAEDITDTIAATAHMLQAAVPKEYEVRLTIVDEDCFPVRIDGCSPAARTDWRSDYDSLRYSAANLPADIRDSARALLRRLGLRFGAFDFVVTPDGEWVFLEVNPNGQWAWLQDETGLPIASAIADALVKR